VPGKTIVNLGNMSRRACCLRGKTQSSSRGNVLLGTQSYLPQRANAKSDVDKNGRDLQHNAAGVAVKATAASQSANMSNWE
jgi:hypothetical protein